jgi:cytochrome c oxidase cbb3-type subunit III
MTRFREGFTAAQLLCLFLVFLEAPSALTVRGASPPPSPQGGLSFGLLPPPDPAAVDRGKQIFSANCAFCHGANATGGETGPDLVRSIVVLHDEGKGTAIGPVILNGRPDRGMPKFNFTDVQIKDLAAFLLARNQAAANRRTYQVLNLVTGNATTGKAFFDSHCASCHSATGDLAHIAGKYDPPTLQERVLFPARKTSDTIPAAADTRSQNTVTVTLPSGQSYSGRLLQLDDFSVSLLDSAGQYHAWELNGGQNGIKVEAHDPLDGHLKLLHEYTDTDIHNLMAYLETLK